jgi:cytochrome c oxidase assembly protein subunit 15
MSQTNSYRPGPHRFALLTAAAALVLIALGGLVTSRGVGMAVYDWPNTFGYNMFFFPVSQWVSGVFYEHTHRLAASAVGLLTSILALWLYGRGARPLMRWAGAALLLLGAGIWLARPLRWRDALVLAATGAALSGASFFWPRCQSSPKWLRRLGLAAFLAVVLQGVLGGLRVVLVKDQLGIFHAALAQLFFVLLCAIAFFTGRKRWSVFDGRNLATPHPGPLPLSRGEGELSSALNEIHTTEDRPIAHALSLNGLGAWLVCATFLILAQLILGATMRHQHAGLAIPDFPAAYGGIWPATDAASIVRYNQQRMEIVSVNPITAGQVILQMVHRLAAGLILCAVAACAWSAWRKLGPKSPLTRLTLVWLALIVAQILLGAATIWSDKAADIATAHVVVGALSLAAGTISSIVCVQNMVFARRVVRRAEAAGAWSQAPLAPRPAG